MKGKRSLKKIRIGLLVIGILFIGLLISRSPYPRSLIFSSDSETRDFATPANTAFKDDALYACIVEQYNADYGTVFPSDNYLGPTYLSKITQLTCNNAGVSDLTGLELLTNLKSLTLNINNLTSIDVSGFTNLTSLSVRNNKLTSITLHSGITYLDVSNNKLSSLNLTKASLLKHLYMGGNLFTSVNLSNNYLLETLESPDGRLTSMDLSENTQLKNVNLASNALSSFNINHNNLVNLDLSGNIIDTLTVTRAGKLNVLNVSNNKLSSVNVNAINTLESLNLSSNLLTTINVSSLSNLKYLYISSNKLSSLDVSGNSKLVALTVGGNDFTATKTVYKNVPINLSDNIFIKLPSGYTSNVNSISNNSYNLSGNTLTPNSGGTESLKVNYNHNITSSSNSYSGTLNLNVVELTSSAYKIDATNNYIFTGMVTDETTIKNNISINMGSFEVSNGKVTVSYGGSVIKTFTIVNYTSSTYNLNLGYIYTGTSSFDLSKINVTGGEKAYKNDKLVISYDGITLKEIPVITLTSTKYDLNNEYILTGGADYTDGIIAPHATITSENGKVVIRYNSTVLKEYVISDFADQNFYNCVVDIYNSKKGTSKTYREMLSDDELLQIGNSLTCVNKGIKNVTGINKLPDLLYINLSQNHISAINLAKYTNLKTLDLTSNALTTINVSENVNLDTLKLGANSLVSIDVAKNSKLVTLELNNNRLLSIGLENNVLLQTLNISSNGLTKIDGSKLEKLNVLNLGSNDLSEIDLTKNLNLTTLDISNNKFTSLDISYLKNLTSLNISENQFVETVQGYKGDKITLGSSVKLPSSLNFAKLVYTSKPTISIANGSEATLLDVGTVQMVGVSSSGYQIATTITVLPDVLDFEENIKPDGDFIYLDPETTVKTVSELIETNGTIVVVNKNGDVLGADKYVGTTAKIKIKFSNEEAVYTVIVKGDLTGDGVIKINDISKLYQSLKEKITLSAIEFYAGDVAEDNVIKINDVSKLYQFLKKKISEL